LRFSIGKLMVLVALCAVNFFLLRKVGSPPSQYGVPERFGELILLGGLPMFDLLGIAALARRPGQRGLDEFLLGGLAALILYLGFAAVAAGWIKDTVIGLLNVIAPLNQGSPAQVIWRVTAAMLCNVLPQVAVAFLLRRWLRASRRREAAQAAPGAPPAD
jgi:hypothetical protein